MLVVREVGPDVGASLWPLHEVVELAVGTVESGRVGYGLAGEREGAGTRKY